MPPSHHPCIDVNECKYLGGFFRHHVKERTNTKKGITKKKCHDVTLEGLDVNRNKRIYKAR
jgi:hypothetical protein